MHLHEIALCGVRSISEAEIEIDQKSEIGSVIQLPSGSGERLKM